MNIGNIIKNKRLELGLTLEELGNEIGVGKSTVRKWENGMIENMGRDKIYLLAKALYISPLTLLGIDEDIYTQLDMSYIKIPLYDNICCGNGGFVDDNIKEMIPVPSKGLNQDLQYFAQYAHGKSMIGAGIDDGDLLIFEKTDKVTSGVIGCFCLSDNKATCKKYKELEHIAMLQPMNNDFEPIIIDPLNNNVRCIGKLKKVIKDFNWED